MTGEAGVHEQIIALLPRLRRFAAALTGSREDGDDLVQDTIARALSRMDQWQEGTHLDRWMMRIARNLWIDNLRSRRPEVSAADYDAELPGVDGRRIVESRLMIRSVSDALDKLPVEQREVLVLVVVDGRSYQEAANLLGIPIGTVMSRLARARRSISRELITEPVAHGSRTEPA